MEGGDEVLEKEDLFLSLDGMLGLEEVVEQDPVFHAKEGEEGAVEGAGHKDGDMEVIHEGAVEEAEQHQEPQQEEMGV